MDTRRGGQRYCPSCKKNCGNEGPAGRIFPDRSSRYPGKKRQIICGKEAEGSYGCGMKWFTLEILQDQVRGPAGKRG
jgi:hypothetical protein